MPGAQAVPVIAPFPWDPLLGYLSLRTTPGVEATHAGRYCRRLGDTTVTVEFDAATQALRCSFDGLPDHPDCLRRVRRLFDTGCEPAEVERVLARSRLLRPRLRRLPGLRVPGCWEPFELCVRVILGQQVSVAAAHTLMRRVAERCPGLEPPRLAAIDLGGLGLTGRRIDSIRLLACAVADGKIRFSAQSWPEITTRLREIPGFGPWTLQYLALRLGRDTDAFPETDLGLLRAAGTSRPAELLRLAEPWRPYRGYAAMYLWAG